MKLFKPRSTIIVGALMLYFLVGYKSSIELSGEEPPLSAIALPLQKITGDCITDGGSIFVAVQDANGSFHNFALPVHFVDGKGVHPKVYSGTTYVRYVEGHLCVDSARAKRILTELLRRFRSSDDEGASNAYYEIIGRGPRFYEEIPRKAKDWIDYTFF